MRVAIAHPIKSSTVTYVLLAITITCFALQTLSKLIFGYDYPLLLGAKVNILILSGEYWRLLTPALLHGSLLHIGFNMYALFVLGRDLEIHYRHGRFLALYILSAIAGNLLSFTLSTSPSVGASTAIFGLVAAQAVFVYRNRFLFGKRYWSLLANIGTIVVINLVLGLSPGIDNWGHLGGLFGGLAFAWFAGPTYSVEGVYPELSLVDRRDLRHTLRVAAIELLVLVLFLFTVFSMQH